jgi:membrane protein
MIVEGRAAERQGALAPVLGVAALLFGATGAFGQLQDALNRVWDVRRDPRGGTLVATAMIRLLSFGMIAAIVFLLLVSLVVSAALGAFAEQLRDVLPGGFSTIALHVINGAVSIAVITLLFALLYSYVPDAEVRWRDVWVGALVTAILFAVGKFTLGLYLGRSEPGSAFGAAGTLALLLVWIYYSSVILFFGAEFTQAWAQQHGEAIRPAEGAVRVFERRDCISATSRSTGASTGD